MTETPTSCGGNGDVRDAVPDQLPNVRLHLRGGQIVETRCEGVETQRSPSTGDLLRLTLRNIERGWPSLTYFRLDAIDVVEWLGTRDHDTDERTTS